MLANEIAAASDSSVRWVPVVLEQARALAGRVLPDRQIAEFLENRYVRK